MSGFSHTEIDLRWYSPSEYEFLDTPENRTFQYVASDGTLVKPAVPFRTNLGSIPLLLTRVFPRDEFALAYANHDWTFDTGRLTVGGYFTTLKYTNWILFDAIGSLCKQKESMWYREWKKYPVYAGVQFGGWYSWNKHNDGRPKAFPPFP